MAERNHHMPPNTEVPNREALPRSQTPIEERLGGEGYVPLGFVEHQQMVGAQLEKALLDLNDAKDTLSTEGYTRSRLELSQAVKYINSLEVDGERDWIELSENNLKKREVNAQNRPNDKRVVAVYEGAKLAHSMLEKSIDDISDNIYEEASSYPGFEGKGKSTTYAIATNKHIVLHNQTLASNAARKSEGQTSKQPESAKSYEADGSSEAIIEKAVRAAQHRSLVHTDMLSGSSVGSGDYTVISKYGFQTFGDTEHNVGESIRIPRNYGEFEFYPESVAIRHATNPIYEEAKPVAGKKGLGLRKNTPPQHPVKVGEEPQYVRNEETRQDEPAVELTYEFYPNSSTDHKVMPYPTHDGRLGNILVTNVVLPETVAQALVASIQKDPAIIRDFAKRIVLENAGVNEDAWVGNGIPTGNPDSRRIKPPYELLPEGWAIEFTDLDTQEKTMLPVK